jgi:hypothetical protein
MTTKTKITAASITTAQIESFASGAASAGDLAMYRICQRALLGSARAKREVARCLRACDAMAD